MKRFKKNLGHNLKKISHGSVKRIDSVGKFGGNIIKQQSNAVAGLTSALSNPLVLVAVGIGGIIVFTKLT